MKQQRFWMGAVSQQHVETGKVGGFAQVCHGKKAPLQRMQVGDILIYYSPTAQYGEKIPYQCFTAIGIITDGPPYQVQMTPDFTPYRRDVLYVKTKDAPIHPLIEELNFIQNKKHWGYVFRFGLLEIKVTDFIIIAKAMQLERGKIDELLL
jgi:hypothetical protein